MRRFKDFKEIITIYDQVYLIYIFDFNFIMAIFSIILDYQSWSCKFVRDIYNKLLIIIGINIIILKIVYLILLC